jgi:hypothetical protein
MLGGDQQGQKIGARFRSSRGSGWPCSKHATVLGPLSKPLVAASGLSGCVRLRSVSFHGEWAFAAYLAEVGEAFECWEVGV